MASRSNKKGRKKAVTCKWQVARRINKKGGRRGRNYQKRHSPGKWKKRDFANETLVKKKNAMLRAEVYSHLVGCYNEVQKALITYL